MLEAQSDGSVVELARGSRQGWVWECCCGDWREVGKKSPWLPSQEMA